MDPNDIISLLEKLAQQLTPAATHVYELAVKQTFIEGIEAVIGLVIISTASIAWFIVGTKKVWGFHKELEKGNIGKAYYDRKDAFTYWLVYGVISVILGLIALMAVGYLIPASLNNLLNPEWQTIVKLSHLVISSK